MQAQLPILIVITPLLFAFVNALVGWFRPRYSVFISIFAMALTFYFSLQTMGLVISDGVIDYVLGGWKAPYGIEYVVDHLNGMVLVVVSFVALLVAIYSKRGVEKEIGDKVAHFYTLFLLLTTGLLGITITGDAFNLYVLLEISALSSYALIALGRGRAYMATFNYLIMGTIGACFYLLGVGYLLIKTGTLNMQDLSTILPSLHTSQAILVAFVFIIVGVLIKMALFPLHGWLPNAYTYAPTATSCLVAPLMTKVSVYVMARMMFSVFSAEYVFEVIKWQPIIMGLAVVSIVAGSFYALAQKDLKKMLTYLIVAEVGYMVGGLWLGNWQGFTGSVYHILADALMTACLFMAIGNIIFVQGHATLDSIKGIFKRMPVTMVGFLIGAFSMIGVPPTCGFFSKWYLIGGAYHAGEWVFLVALLFSSLVNAVLFFRVIEIGFFSALPSEEPHVSHGEDSTTSVQSGGLLAMEAPLSMVVPLLVMSSMLILVGVYNNHIITTVIRMIIPSGLSTIL